MLDIKSYPWLSRLIEMKPMFRGFWNKHRKRILIALGAFGSGYFIYKLYDSRKRRALSQFEQQLHVEELIKTQLQTHFENIQRISDTTTLPFAMHYLCARLSAELDLSHLTEKLMQGKSHSRNLMAEEKLELWEKLKVLSFTRTASSLWTMTMLSLYVRVQVNILGRHLYLQMASGAEVSKSQGESDSLNKHGQQDFLGTADFLSIYRLDTLIKNMQSATQEVLKEKQLNDPFSMTQLHETIMKILERFMRIDEPDYWISYLIPENAAAYRQLLALSTDELLIPMDVSKLDQLMSETRAVLLSSDFLNIALISLEKVVDMLIDNISAQFGGSITPLGIPLAKIVPRVAHLNLPLLEEPSSNKFVQIIRSLPEVELFYTFLYANIPLAS